MPIVAMAASMAGNLREGLADSLWVGKGNVAKSNAQQVRNVRQILTGFGLEIASAEEVERQG
jgi:uncharacterized protein (DUF849 family)